MNYLIKKEDFLLNFHTRKTGIILVITRQHYDQKQEIGLVVPENVYILSNGKWALLDANKIVDPNIKYVNNTEKASFCLTIAATRIPIGDKSIKFDPYEYRFIQTLTYDMSLKTPIDWLVKADYYIVDGKNISAVIDRNIYKYKYPSNNDVKSLKYVETCSIGPQIIMSPSNNPKTPISVQTVSVQKKSSQKIAPKKSSDPIDFNKLIKDRSQWKKDNPNWKDPNWEKEHAVYMKHSDDKKQKQLDLEKQKKLEMEKQAILKEEQFKLELNRLDLIDQQKNKEKKERLEQEKLDKIKAYKEELERHKKLYIEEQDKVEQERLNKVEQERLNTVEQERLNTGVVDDDSDTGVVDNDTGVVDDDSDTEVVDDDSDTEVGDNDTGVVDDDDSDTEDEILDIPSSPILIPTRVMAQSPRFIQDSVTDDLFPETMNHNTFFPDSQDEDEPSSDENESSSDENESSSDENESSSDEDESSSDEDESSSDYDY